MEEYVESQPWGKTIFDVEKGSKVSFKTIRAQVDIITNPYFGRMLFIDEVLQSSRADEEIYHLAVTKSISANVPARVLIVGGSEGAVSRDLFKQYGEGIKEVVQV
jgi:spermidine synthase